VTSGERTAHGRAGRDKRAETRGRRSSQDRTGKK
jgi:hypothetical protein